MGAYQHCPSCKYHLVGTMDDRGQEVVVSRWWARTRQRWEYETTPLWLVLLWIEQKETQ